ncbi:multisubunit Na+/H+ antiporter, MnhG subunit [Serpentinimonas maccroryi]|uniref:Multisubunit Na+/H+ antiporter, MnhG subunit n=1 Tax=Serpentinimonas maccroryi TaxID=1458426 RepID=A0A060NP24_9BURK|nr:monovalent cation/H(+) antiporter subunit G [Serpentinimonas maccroryi]BAO83125.1 multisubunit Na+/H+ antiporter, MnhG subunit [Serpentinimonas maccroryi]
MLLELLVAVFLLAAGVLLLIAAWGVVALPDALARQHAATKAGTLALATACVGAMLFAFDWAWSWRILLILGFLFATLPVASHMLARAAVRESRLIPDVSQVPLIGDDPAQGHKPGSGT